MTDAPKTFTTSPMLVLRPRQHGATVVEPASGDAFDHLSLLGAQLVHFAAVPRSLTEAAAAGYGSDVIDRAVADGLIVWIDSPHYHSTRMWEEANWTRPAYALFSQFNLTYAEEGWGAKTLDQHVSGRRAQIEKYAAESPLPQRFRVVPVGEEFVLPRPATDTLRLNLDRLFARRSIRSFSRTPLPLADFATVLYGATANIRIAAASQAGGDPFYLLNSFYSWLELFVLVQGVEGLASGFYQYDAMEHALLPLGRTAENEEVAATIANQNWIGGNGFCLFVAVDWQRYMWTYRHARAYFNLITQIGEFGQEVCQHASNCNLGSWLTPAVNEDAAARMLGLDGTRLDPLLFIKVGTPDQADSSSGR